MITTALERALSWSLVLLMSAALSCVPETTFDQAAHPWVGRAGLKLVVASSLSVENVSYVISGNGFSKTGTAAIDTLGHGFSFTVQDIPAGKSYQIDLSAIADDGSTGKGAAKFDITPRAISVVHIVLRFFSNAPTTGSALINGTSNVCPVVSSLAAEPSPIEVGSSSQLTGAAFDNDNLPALLSYAWTVEPAGVGTLSDATSPNPIFTATAPGAVTLTLSVSDGDDPCRTLVGSLSTLALQIQVTGAANSGVAHMSNLAMTDAPSVARTAAVSGNQDQPSGYALVFNDEFSGTTLDRSVWCTRYAYGGGQPLQFDDPECTGPDGYSGTLDFLNAEQQRYVDTNKLGQAMHVLGGGFLSLRATNTGTDSYARYEAAMIRSKWEFKPSETESYYITARVRLPNVKGTWPALWLASGFGKSGALVWPPEIDILEGPLNGIGERDNMLRIGGQIRGAQTLTGAAEFIYHDSATYNRDSTNFSSPSSLRDVWFVIAAEWTDESVCYFVNGLKTMCENYRWVDNQGVTANGASLLLNLAIGGEWAGAGGIDDSSFPTSFDIDYVRVYRR